MTAMDYPGERMIRRLFETLSENGVASLLQPWHLRKQVPSNEVLQQLNALSLSWDDMALESGKRLRIDGRTMNTNRANDLPECCPGLRSHSDTKSDLVKTITQDFITDRFRQQVNLSKAVLFAEAELAVDLQAPPDSWVDGDWLLRWRRRAGDISSDELSLLWGRILAGEIRHPGSCSLRSLEFLGNLSRGEAIDIERVAPFALGNVILKHEGLFEKVGVSFDILSELQELGLISGIAANLNTTIKSEITGEFQFTWPVKRLGKRLLIRHDDPVKILRIPVIHVSRLGKEVFAVAHSTLSKDCLVAMVMLIEGQDYTVRIEEL